MSSVLTPKSWWRRWGMRFGSQKSQMTCRRPCGFPPSSSTSHSAPFPWFSSHHCFSFSYFQRVELTLAVMWDSSWIGSSYRILTHFKTRSELNVVTSQQVGNWDRQNDSLKLAWAAKPDPVTKQKQTNIHKPRKQPSNNAGCLWFCEM